MRPLVIALTLGGLLNGLPRVMSLATATDDASAYLDQLEPHYGRVEAAAKRDRIDGRYTPALGATRSVSDMRVEKSSGDKQFDASAVQAVSRA